MAMGSKSEAVIARHVHELTTFSRGNVSGAWFEDGRAVPSGRLAVGFLTNLWTYGPVYVVFSYGTPIAWRPAGRDTAWHCPYIRYSTTTSNHQGMIRRIIRTGPAWQRGGHDVALSV